MKDFGSILESLKLVYGEIVNYINTKMAICMKNNAKILVNFLLLFFIEKNLREKGESAGVWAKQKEKVT